MKMALLVFFLIPIGLFIGFIFADVLSSMKRSNNRLKTNSKTTIRDYKQNKENYYNKRQKHGKVIKTKYKAVK